MDRSKGACRACILAVTVGSILSAPAQAAEERVHRRWRQRVMGTELIIEAYGSSTQQVDSAILAAVQEMERIEDEMTSWRPSPLMTLNEAAGKGPQKVSLELAQIISRGLELGRLTNGAFDITFAGVGQLWDFKSEAPILPNPVAIRNSLQHVGYERVLVDPDSVSVDLPKGMRIGLGGIAKGYGVDRAMKTLIHQGIQHAVVNAGGDMKILGLHQGEPREIAIKHPRDRERAMAVFRVSNKSVVTSGDYERFFEKDGKRYHHIIDPRTGYSANGCLSATVVTASAEYADALATALCVLGPEKAKALIGRLPGVEAIWVAMDGQVHVSEGLKQAIVDAERDHIKNPSAILANQSHNYRPEIHSFITE